MLPIKCGKAMHADQSVLGEKQRPETENLTQIPKSQTQNVCTHCITTRRSLDLPQTFVENLLDLMGASKSNNLNLNPETRGKTRAFHLSLIDSDTILPPDQLDGPYKPLHLDSERLKNRPLPSGLRD
mmetsp:Transcript_12532/g.19714  ORF Transcript_12532/g.19714 Transcript_12532/m.19714 type:complete len:127 (+) Transcript_12532:75-455(+)